MIPPISVGPRVFWWRGLTALAMCCWLGRRSLAVARRAAATMLVRRGLAATAVLLPGVDDVVEFDAAWVFLDPPRIDDPAIADLLEAVEARHFRRSTGADLVPPIAAAAGPALADGSRAVDRRHL